MFGPPFLIETCITAYRNQDQLIGKSHLCRAIHCKPDQRFTITHCNLSKKSLDSICIHMHPYAIINCIRPTAKCLLNLTQAHEPLCDIPATQTCNCCLLVVDFSTWNHVKYTEDSWNEVPKTGNKLNVVSHLCHISPVAPPSHHVRPVTSVPSLRAGTIVILRLDGGARGQQRLDHLQVAVVSRQVHRPGASVRRAPLEMATGRAKSHELLRRISEDFGSEKLGVWSCLVHHF